MDIDCLVVWTCLFRTVSCALTRGKFFRRNLVPHEALFPIAIGSIMGGLMSHVPQFTQLQMTTNEEESQLN